MNTKPNIDTFKIDANLSISVCALIIPDEISGPQVHITSAYVGNRDITHEISREERENIEYKILRITKERNTDMEIEIEAHD